MAMFGKRVSGKAATDSSGRTDVTHPGSSPAQKTEAQHRATLAEYNARQVASGRPSIPFAGSVSSPSSPMASTLPRIPGENVIKIDSSSNSNPAPTLSRREQKRKNKALKNIEPLGPQDKSNPFNSENGFKRSEQAQGYDAARFAEQRIANPLPAIPGTVPSKEHNEDIVDTYKKFGTLRSKDATVNMVSRKNERDRYR